MHDLRAERFFKPQTINNFAASAELRAALKLNPPEQLAARILHLLMALGQ